MFATLVGLILAVRANEGEYALEKGCWKRCQLLICYMWGSVWLRQDPSLAWAVDRSAGRLLLKPLHDALHLPKSMGLVSVKDLCR